MRTRWQKSSCRSIAGGSLLLRPYISSFVLLKFLQLVWRGRYGPHHITAVEIWSRTSPWPPPAIPYADGRSTLETTGLPTVRQDGRKLCNWNNANVRCGFCTPFVYYMMKPWHGRNLGNLEFLARVLGKKERWLHGLLDQMKGKWWVFVKLVTSKLSTTNPLVFIGRRRTAVMVWIGPQRTSGLWRKECPIC